MMVLFWGTGSYAYNWIKNNADFLKYIDIVKFVQKNKIENRFCEIEVILPEEISLYNYDYLVIMSSFINDIKIEAIRDYNIESDKIISTYEFEKILLMTINWNCVKNKLLVRHFISTDEKLSNYVNDYYDYQYLKEDFKEYIDNYYCNKKTISECNLQMVNKIWFCWLQGLSNAPSIVQACYNSIKINMPDYDIVVITNDNLDKYIELPDYVRDKYEKNIIIDAHFSDLIRLELLIKYGGIWIDATLLLTASLPTIIKNSNLFLFNFNKTETIEPRNISNWFIVSKPNNNILILTRELLYLYWKENERAINYYIFHYFFRMSAEKFSREWNQELHIVGNTNLLQKHLFSDFDKEKYEYIKSISFCQKLTHKISVPLEKTKGTMYEAVLNEYLRKY